MTDTNTLQTLITRLLQREGGYVNHPADRGGPTNFGITQAVLTAWRNVPATADDVEALDDVEARAVYEELFWVQPGFNRLTLAPLVIEMLFDTAVHSGPRTAVKMLQRALCVADDGILGPITRHAAERLDSDYLAALFMAERIEFIGALITRRPEQAAFAAGWAKRIGEFVMQIPTARGPQHG